MNFKKINILFVSIIMFLLLVSCNTVINDPNPDPDPDPDIELKDELYTMSTKTIEGIDVFDNYIFSTVELKTDNTAIISDLDIRGLNVLEGTYEINELEVNIVIGLRVLKYIKDNENKTLSFDGRVDRKQVKMTYKLNNEFTLDGTKGSVSFTDELFGDNIEENFYNYAPTIIMENETTMHIWYCGNEIDGNVTDYIIHRVGTMQLDGKWIFSEKDIVLAPTPGTWDERHVCDPSVIKGLFKYRDEDYEYLMSYLGCITNDSSRNEVGIAVSKSINGPWVKVDELNPIANYYESEEYTKDSWTWGYGQPSLISVDKLGKVLMFYTKGLISDTYTQVELWDFSDLNNPIKLNEAPVSNGNMVNAHGQPDVINNGDFAYDPILKRLYVIKEDFPYKDSGGLSWLTSHNTVMYLNLDSNESYVGETLFSGKSLRWQMIGSIGEEQTGFARVHNSGIVTNLYGHIINPFQIPIVYTKSDLVTDYPDWNLGGQWPALHTYRLHGFIFEI